MSDTLISLRRKIRRAGDLQSVVSTMKALAAASIGQYEQSVKALADYSRTVELGLSVCFRNTPSRASTGQQTKPTAGGTVGAIVFGSDQGLVGQFNETIVEQAVHYLSAYPGHYHVLAVGERVQARLADAGIDISGFFPVPNSVKAITPFIGQILLESERHHSMGEVAELHLFYNRPTSRTGYASANLRLLPLDETWRNELTALPWPTKKLPEIIGSSTVTLQTLIHEYLFVSLFRACAESLASENASRLTAMQRAEKNIDELLEGLTRSFHQLRQRGIDEELFDVISGFEALAKESTTPGHGVSGQGIKK